jgi:uncharacterized OB-fold protein
VAVLDGIDKLDRCIVWKGDIPITSRYTAGIAGERFYREMQENAQVLGTRCNACGITYVPAALFCERCLAQLNDWVEVGFTGKVFTFTVLYQDLDREPLSEPEVLAYIKLDGCDGGLVHRLGGVAPDELRIGMRVKAVWKSADDRVGSILDIRHFAPEEGRR